MLTFYDVFGFISAGLVIHGEALIGARHDVGHDRLVIQLGDGRNVVVAVLRVALALYLMEMKQRMA